MAFKPPEYQYRELPAPSIDDFLNRNLSQHPKHESSILEAKASFSRFVAMDKALVPAGCLPPLQLPQEGPSHRKARQSHNQYIPFNMNPEKEAFVLGVKFLAMHPPMGAFIELPQGGFFASPHYSASYIFAETVRSLGYKPIEAVMKKQLNPRGGFFQPIGVVSLYITLADRGVATYIK